MAPVYSKSSKPQTSKPQEARARRYSESSSSSSAAPAGSAASSSMAPAASACENRGPNPATFLDQTQNDMQKMNTALAEGQKQDPLTLSDIQNALQFFRFGVSLCDKKSCSGYHLEIRGDVTEDVAYMWGRKWENKQLVGDWVECILERVTHDIFLDFLATYGCKPDVYIGTVTGWSQDWCWLDVDEDGTTRQGFLPGDKTWGLKVGDEVTVQMEPGVKDCHGNLKLNRASAYFDQMAVLALVRKGLGEDGRPILRLEQVTAGDLQEEDIEAAIIFYQNAKTYACSHVFQAKSHKSQAADGAAAPAEETAQKKKTQQEQKQARRLNEIRLCANLLRRKRLFDLRMILPDDTNSAPMHSGSNAASAVNAMPAESQAVLAGSGAEGTTVSGYHGQGQPSNLMPYGCSWACMPQSMPQSMPQNYVQQNYMPSGCVQFCMPAGNVPPPLQQQQMAQQQIGQQQVMMLVPVQQVAFMPASNGNGQPY